MWMSSPLHTRPLFSFFLHDYRTSRPKRDLLLCVARHPVVTLTRNAPLSKAQSPGISVSSIEPSGVFLSRFCLSSSRSLGRCLLLGQRSRMNLFSHLIGSLLHQDHRNPHTQLTRYRHNSHPGSDLTRVFAANRTEKLPQLTVLSDRRPRRLDELASQPFISGAGDRSPIHSLPGGMLGGHQTQKPGQLTDVVKLSPIADAGQELAGGNPADAGNRHQILDTLRQLEIIAAETADLGDRLKNLLFVKLQTVKQLLQLKAHRPRAGKLAQFILDQKRPLTAGGSGRKLDPFEEQQRFNPLLHPGQLAYQHIAQLCQMAKLAVSGRGNMDALQLSPTQILRQAFTVEPVRLHSLSWRSRNHRRRGDQTRIGLGCQSIIQPIPRRSSLIDKGSLLIREVLADIIHQMLCLVRHVQRSDKSLMIRKRYRHLFFAYVQARKDIVLCWYKVGFHRAPPLFLVLSNRTLITGGPLRGLDIHHTSLINSHIAIGWVNESARKTEGSLCHGFPEEGLHAFDFRSRGWPVFQANNRCAQLAGADKREHVYRNALLFQP